MQCNARLTSRENRETHGDFSAALRAITKGKSPVQIVTARAVYEGQSSIRGLLPIKVAGKTRAVIANLQICDITVHS